MVLNRKSCYGRYCEDNIERDKATARMAFNGYCLVMVQADQHAGKIRLKASSENLRAAEVVLKVK